MTEAELSASLLNAVREQRAILFLGSGASHGAKAPSGQVIPQGNALRDKLCDRFLGGELKDKPLLTVASIAASEAGLIQMQKYIADLFEPYRPGEFHLLVPSFRWRAIATTNYDLIIERAYEGCRKPLQRYVKTVKDGDQFDTRMNAMSDPVGLFKLHGCIEHYTDLDVPLILGQEQYAAYLANRKRMYAMLQGLAQECPIIFCGYSISDPHIQQIIFDLTDRRISRPTFFAVAPNFSLYEIKYWGTNRIECITMTFEQFIRTLDSAIPLLARQLRRNTSPDNLSLQSHYRVATAVETDALRFYIDNDAIHVHGAMVTPYQIPLDFYKGYDVSFGCITQNLDIDRPISKSVLFDAILLDESEVKDTELFVLVGPAGNGKTVTLKRVAWEAATAYERLVLYTGVASGVRIEPLREIHELTGKRIYLFVDRASLVRDQIHELIKRNRSEKIPITIVCAERENEWRVYCEHLVPYVSQEFSVEYLGLQEIVSLLELLERHHALGFLADRSPRERIQAFEVRADRQLLVALHETTLGVPFEKIVLSEYEGIPEEARQLYLDVCALHQFGTPVRAGLISRVSGISFSEFGIRFLGPLTQVVIVEGDKSGARDVFYRSRHQRVAELVFNQVANTDEKKFALLSKLMKGMNVEYTSDEETFGRLIRGRALAQIFGDAEIGRRLYQEAVSVAGRPAFVYHQLAVFEQRHSGGSLKKAEEAISEAARLAPNTKSILHTQAEIFRRLANATQDSTQKRAYRRSARRNLDTDIGQASGYDLLTKARLALDELKEVLNAGVPDTDALLRVTREAEEAFQRARAEFPDSPEILAAEADFLDVLDKAPKALAALEKAFKINPSLDWLAMRLAERYANQGNAARAIEVLQQSLSKGVDSKGLHLAMAKILRAVDSAEGRILDHLRRAFVPGDLNFEAQFLYGRELFLAKSTDESKAVFARLNQRAPGRFRNAVSELAKQADGNVAEFSGVVARKEQGYGFIRLTDFGIEVFASHADSSRSNWDQIVKRKPNKLPSRVQ